MNGLEMQHYKSSEWNFELDMPRNWVASPADRLNSPNEVIRFGSSENGRHLLIIFRASYDPPRNPQSHAGQVQQVLAQSGFSNFVAGEIAIGTQRVLTLDFDKPAGGTWSCRHYFFFDGPVVYTLGFGTNRRAAVLDLFDQMAKSFVFGKPAG
jgi:hypothetical protein